MGLETVSRGEHLKEVGIVGAILLEYKKSRKTEIWGTGEIHAEVCRKMLTKCHLVDVVIDGRVRKPFLNK
jgi:hypothetical protein